MVKKVSKKKPVKKKVVKKKIPATPVDKPTPEIQPVVKEPVMKKDAGNYSTRRKARGWQ